MTSGPSRRARSIRTLIVLWTVVPLLLMQAVLVGVVIHATNVSARVTARAIGRSNAVAVERDLARFSAEVEARLSVAAAALSAGLIDAPEETIRRFFTRIAADAADGSSIYLGTPDGALIGAGEDEGGAYYTTTRTGPFIKQRIGRDPDEAPLARVADFDATSRPWYTAALATPNVAWGVPYVVATRDRRATAASLRLVDADGAIIGVVGTDVFLPDLATELGGISAATTSKIVVVAADGTLIASVTPSAGPWRAIFAPDESNPLLPDLIDGRSPADDHPGPTVYDVMVDRERLVVAATVWRAGTTPSRVLVGTAFETAFSEIAARFRWFWVGLAALTGASALLSLRWARRIARPLVSIAEAIGSLDTARRVVVPTRFVPREIGSIAETLNRLSRDLSAARTQTDETLGSLRASVAERETLLHELNHRTKNNMNLLASLVRIQMRDVGDPHATAILSDLVDRIHAMALVHTRLYHSGSFAELDLGEHMEEVAALFADAAGLSGRGVAVVTTVEKIVGTVDTAVALGLIAAELITNAVRHGFGDTGGRIEVRLTSAADGARLTVADDGVGMPVGVDPRTATSMGLTTVRMIAEHQLGGTIEFTSGAGGTTCTCTFRLEAT